MWLDNLKELKKEKNISSKQLAERDALKAERDLVIAENSILKDKNAALSAETDLLKLQLKHKEELLALHNFYNKLNPNS